MKSLDDVACKIKMIRWEEMQHKGNTGTRKVEISEHAVARRRGENWTEMRRVDNVRIEVLQQEETIGDAFAATDGMVVAKATAQDFGEREDGTGSVKLHELAIAI